MLCVRVNLLCTALFCPESVKHGWLQEGTIVADKEKLLSLAACTLQLFVL